MRAVIISALVAAATAQLVPRVTNSLGCDHFGTVNGVTCAIPLVEGFDRMATFTLDEPIVCATNDDFECSVIVNISNSHPHLVAVQPCFVRWDRTQWHQPRQVRITAVQNYRSVAGESHQIHLNTQVLSRATYYNGFNLEGFFIETLNRRTAQCRSTGDPHYTTFDGKYWHYYQASTVTLYRAPNRDFAIQTRTRAYPGRNCAIAGRENADRVIIDNCGGGLRIQTNFHSTNPQVHPRVQVSGNTYTVYFYSGAWMRTQVNGWGMNVYTSSVDATPSNAAPGHDYSCGLCGNFDGNRNNDVPGYRITSYAPLFPCMKVPSVAIRPSDGTVVTFGNIFTWVYNAADFTTLTPIVPLPAVTCPYTFQRIIRPIINTQDTEDITNALNNRATNAQDQGGDGFGFTFGGGTTGGNTTTVTPDFPLDQSRAACVHQITVSITVQRCSQLYASFNNTLANYTEDCTEDYSHVGGPATQAGADFLDAAMRALEAECLQLAVQNNDTSLLTLQQVLCDNACSQRGSCGAGAVCTCRSPFGGADCSVNLNAPPVITASSDIIYDSAGFNSNHTPAEILLSGTNFLPSANLSCKFNDTITGASYIGVTQILCIVPALLHRGPTQVDVPLTVSNDGVTWSNGTNVRFVYYDGTCQTCSNTGVCGPNPSTCTIGGQCYLPHTQRPADATSPTSNPCQICLPAASNTDWTYDYLPSVCHPTFSLPIYATDILGAATAGTSMLTVDATTNNLVNSDPQYSVTYTYSSSLNDPRITQWFVVNPTTGEITLNATVNMSDPVFMNMQHAATNPQNFNGFFRVIATDNQNYTSVTDVTIDLVPLSVHGAVFPPFGFVGVVNESIAAAGSPVYNFSNPTQPLVISPLNSSFAINAFEWFLQPSGLSGALRIDPNTGAVTVQNGHLIDFETDPALDYRVRATATLQYITPLFVHVLDVPEAPTAIDTSPSSPTIVEGPRTSNFVANLSTVDGDANATSDGGPFSYLLLNNQADFELRQWVAGLSATTYLAARPSRVFDFETGPTALSATVRTTDPTGRSFDQVINVTVTNVNEAPTNIVVAPMPAGSQPVGVTVNQTSTSCTISALENLTLSSVVASLSATDPDIGSLPPQCYVVDALNHFTQDAQHQFMVLQTPLDYESNSNYVMSITCVDAIDFSLEVNINCTVLVGDVPEAPTLAAYNYTGGVINETEVRNTSTVVGTITVNDTDAGSSGQITVIPPPGFTVNPPCTGPPATVCVTNLVLLPETNISFVNSTRGVITVPLVITQGGLNRTVFVNVTVSDEPELPSDIEIVLAGPLFENPPIGFTVARITIVDPDTTPQNFSVTLDLNPNGAFVIEEDPNDVSSRWVKVANPAAIDFVEPPLTARNRRQLPNNTISFSVVVSEPAHAHLGVAGPFPFSLTIADQPLVGFPATATISPVPGVGSVQFQVLHQDMPALDQSLVWTLESTDMTAAMGSISLSPSGLLTVTSPSGLCAIGGANTFTVLVRYNFSSFSGVLPSGYQSQRFQTLVTIGSAPEFPHFMNRPASGYLVNVMPIRASSQVATSSVSVLVGAPCDQTLGYNLAVVDTPVPVAATAILTGQELVRTGAGFTRPASLAELQSNLQTGVWNLSDVMTAPEASSTVSSTNPFAFTVEHDDDGVVQTGSQTNLRVHYSPAASPSLGLTETTKVLLAELVGTPSLSVTAPITIQYLDSCGVNQAGQQVLSNTCAAGETCIPIFQNQAWDYTCQGPIIIVPPPPPQASAANASGSSDNLGLYIGIIVLVLLAILFAAFLYFRRQKATHEETWDSSDRNRLPTYRNPTYETAGGVARTGDTTFRAGVASAVYDWYKPSMTRRDCTDHLMAQGEGSFVVRDSDSNPGWHMLGVKTSNRVVHDKIRLTDTGEYELLPSVGSAADDKQPSFATLPDLIDHYLLNGEQSGLGYQLIDSNPIYDNHQLVQERTGTAVKKDYAEVPAIPEKRHYDEPANLTGSGDGVSNPMYGRDNMVANPDGYLDVVDDPTDQAVAYESI